MLIIFGRSPFINEIRDEIPLLIKKHTTMGINYVCNTFPDVDYVMYYDNIRPNVKNSTIITSFKNAEKENADLIYAHKYELYNIRRNGDTFSEEPTFLHFCVHTPSMALNWAYLKGYKDVVLAGIDLIPNTLHFDENKPIFEEKTIITARNHLENVATKYLNIYQLNPNSDLKLPKISMEELLEIYDKEREEQEEPYARWIDDTKEQLLRKAQ